MADPFQPTSKERFQRIAGMLILLAIVGGVGSFIWSVVQSGEQPVEYETMTVVSFGMGSGFDGSRPVIRVQDSEGLEYPVSSNADIGESCQIGDTIAIIRQGINLRVGPEACGVAQASR